jgi:hypothetical protein
MKYLKLMIVIVSFICISGCAMLGITQWQLQHEKVKYSKSFEKDAQYCYQATKDALAKWNALVWYEQEGAYIIAMNFDKIYKNCIDTTELGIFFKEEALKKTQVEVSSMNHHLSQYVSEKLFRYISNPQAPDEAQ